MQVLRVYAPQKNTRLIATEYPTTDGTRKGGPNAASSAHLLHKSPGRFPFASFSSSGLYRSSCRRQVPTKPAASPKYLALGWSPDVGSASCVYDHAVAAEASFIPTYIQRPRFALLLFPSSSFFCRFNRALFGQLYKACPKYITYRDLQGPEAHENQCTLFYDDVYARHWLTHVMLHTTTNTITRKGGCSGFGCSIPFSTVRLCRWSHGT